MATPPPPRLAILFAREAARALLFRRGPTKRVELVLWNTKTDRFEVGQWFTGRIYEHRCDLSPDGHFLVYFASKFNARTVADSDYTYAWTAVSRPPYLTALALWPKGNCWWGGGLFQDNYTLLLNHRPKEAVPHPAHIPTRIRVTPNAEAAGEDDPLYSQRLERDGWTLQQEWRVEWRDMEQGYETLTPEVRERQHPDGWFRISLTRRLDNLRYSEHFHVLGPAGSVAIALAKPSWLDWDHRGRLVALARGGLWVANVRRSGIGEFTRLLDLTKHRYQARPSPDWAKEW